MNRFAQIAASAALRDNDHVIKTTRNNRSQMNRIMERLRYYNITYYGTGANFILFRLKNSGKGAFHDFLAKNKYLIRLGGIEDPDFEYLRASIGLPEHSDRFCALLDEYME